MGQDSRAERQHVSDCSPGKGTLHTVFDIQKLPQDPLQVLLRVNEIPRHKGDNVCGPARFLQDRRLHDGVDINRMRRPHYENSFEADVSAQRLENDTQKTSLFSKRGEVRSFE